MKNICEWDNCKESGEFKAPLEKDNSKKEQQAQQLFDRTKKDRKKVTENVHNIKEKMLIFIDCKKG